MTNPVTKSPSLLHRAISTLILGVFAIQATGCDQLWAQNPVRDGFQSLVTLLEKESAARAPSEELSAALALVQALQTAEATLSNELTFEEKAPTDAAGATEFVKKLIPMSSPHTSSDSRTAPLISARSSSTLPNALTKSTTPPSKPSSRRSSTTASNSSAHTTARRPKFSRLTWFTLRSTVFEPCLRSSNSIRSSTSPTSDTLALSS